MWLKHMRNFFLPGLLAFSALIVIAIQPSTIFAQTASDLCGSTITSDLQLTSDITCEEDGITVGGNNLTVNLNGFTISGPGPDSSTTGILVQGFSGVKITGPGMVTNFGNGVAYTGATGGSMREVFVGTSDIGVLLDGTTGTVINHDYIADNRIGILNRASHSTVLEELQMSSNDEGVRLEDSTRVDVDFNVVMDGLTAIYLDEQSIDNRLFYNIMFRNEVQDMNILGPGGRNLLGHNECIVGTPADVCTGRLLPGGDVLAGSTGGRESIERATSEPQNLSPEQEQAANALRERVIAGGIQNQTST
jgi:hypothetical protein